MKLQLKATVVAIVVLATASLAATGTPAAPARTSAFPSNGQLAWVNPTGPCEASDPCGKVVVANPDGKARRTIHLPWDASYPVWSPDGSKLLVIARRPNLPPRPAIVNPDGSDLTVLDPPNLGLGSPFELGCTSWSPDGTRLLCAAVNGGPGGGAGLFTLRASDGGDPIRLTTAPPGYYDGYAKYSPDGTRIAFIRAVDGDMSTGAIFVANADGTKPQRVTDYGVPMSGGLEGLNWSPNGTEIIFMAQPWSLDTIHPDGTGLHELVHGQDGCPCAMDPTFSPDGTHIAFANSTPTDTDIFTANADATDPIDITNTPDSHELEPNWGTHPLAPACTAAEKAKRAKALATYKRHMAAERRAYFRTHHAAKARAAFAKAQRAKLKRLERRVKACAGT